MSNAKEKRTRVEMPCRIIYEAGKRSYNNTPVALPLAKIPLSCNAVEPESIKLSMFGEDVIPTLITYDGVPKFSEEASLILFCKEYIAKEGRLVGTEAQDVKVQATYTEAEQPTYDVEEIDTISEIEQAITSLELFYDLCLERQFYAKTIRKSLHSFIIFGRILLDEHGLVRRIDRMRDHIYNLEIAPDDLPLVCTKEHFSKYVTSYECSTPFRVPCPGEKCPVCGREFTIKDLYEPLTLISHGLWDEVVHDKCKQEFEYYLEIKTLVFDIVDSVYTNRCKFEILPNPNLLDKANLHIPWVLVHTPCGDIKLGRKYGKFTIEWQSNYKPFDISGFNYMEKSIKWTEDRTCFTTAEKGTTSTTGVRGIVVENVADAIEVLRKAHSLAFFPK